jgi:hypothetical protein
VQKIDTALNFVVVHVKTEKPRCPIATQVTVRMGDMPIAKFSRGGKYSKLQAEAEFRRNRNGLVQLQPGWDMAASLKVV